MTILFLFATIAVSSFAIPAFADTCEMSGQPVEADWRDQGAIGRHDGGGRGPRRHATGRDPC